MESLNLTMQSQVEAFEKVGIAAPGPYSEKQIIEMIERVVGKAPSPGKLRLITDTTEFFQVDYNDVVSVGEELFLIRGSEREGRFGLDDEPKHWVKKAWDLRTSRRKVIKLAFFERYQGKIGSIRFEFFRNPKKEARILELVRGHPNFMQGYAVEDEKKNILRILEYVKGTSLHALLGQIKENHEAYFHHTFPGILYHLIEAYEAIRFLHDNQEIHGDIRRDHLFVDSETGRYVWIDFDYTYRSSETRVGFDLFGLGNIITFLVGKGDISTAYLQQNHPEIFCRIKEEDLGIVFLNRVANLKKVYPYIPDKLNRILMHFSHGAEVFYESVDELLEDLRSCQGVLPGG
jgi:tRNA A-37 threonylcarbamoyl transferase component Bud32